MIDLHCHILPGIDDGAPNLEVSLLMARAAVADGVTTIACTPHIMPGLYHNTGPQIREATLSLQGVLDQEGIPLRLATGADVHMVPDLVAGLRSDRLLSVADSRYVLVEPPHHVAPAKLEEFFFDLIAAGYIPVMTHPERLLWIEAHYAKIQRLVRGGVWMQITAGSLIGTFGRTARHWAERMLDDGCVHLLATDAHDMMHRPPCLSRGRELSEKRVGSREAEALVLTRPSAVLANETPSNFLLPEMVRAAGGP